MKELEYKRKLKVSRNMLYACTMPSQSMRQPNRSSATTRHASTNQNRAPPSALAQPLLLIQLSHRKRDKHMNELEDKRTLRRKMLEYFKDANVSRNMHKEDTFKGYSNQEIRDMMYACNTAGLIAKLRGKASGTYYITVDDGLILMQAMDLAIKVDKKKSKE